MNTKIDKWFQKQLTELGINQTEASKSIQKTPQQRICDFLIKLKKELEQINRKKEPQRAYDIIQNIEKFDLLYEYKINLLNLKAIINKGSTGLLFKKEMELLEEEIEELEKKQKSSDDKKGTAKWAYNIIEKKIDIKKLGNEKYANLACIQMINFYKQMQLEKARGKYVISEEFQKSIEKFDLNNYCQNLKEVILKQIVGGENIKSREEYSSELKEISDFEEKTIKNDSNSKQEKGIDEIDLEK